MRKRPRRLRRSGRGEPKEGAEGAVPEAAPAEKALVGEVIDLHELWACTNCMYCQEHCSASIEHVPKIVGMRQYKVLTEADFAPELQLTYRNMENNSNPWGIGSHLRADWAKELGIKTLAEDPAVEYLFYVGCAGSFDDRGKKVSAAFAKILKAAGVSFGILGTEEGCCGDSAMRGGNEYLYQTLAQANIEVMKNYNVKKIVTTCPHGYNALKKDYPHFGGEFEVYHHTEIIADLIAKGKIALKKPVEGLATYHDSCFLGRYNAIYDQPRRILGAVPGLKLTEMERDPRQEFLLRRRRGEDVDGGGYRRADQQHADRPGDRHGRRHGSGRLPLLPHHALRRDQGPQEGGDDGRPRRRGDRLAGDGAGRGEAAGRRLCRAAGSLIPLDAGACPGPDPGFAGVTTFYGFIIKEGRVDENG